MKFLISTYDDTDHKATEYLGGSVNIDDHGILTVEAEDGKIVAIFNKDTWISVIPQNEA